MVLLYVLMMLAKLAMEHAYISFLTADKITYPLDFSTSKYLYGMVWLTIMFACIRHDCRRASTFLLEFFYFMNFIPVTIIYALQNESTVYYTCICLAMTICEVLVQLLKNVKINFTIRHWDKIIIAGGILLLLVFIVIAYKNNGLPTTKALNLYDVYELRASGLYKTGKYIRYIQSLLIFVVIPILITMFVREKKYVLAIIIYGMEFVIYLYEGQKTFLFTGMMVFVITWWADRKNFEKEFWTLFLSGITLISVFLQNGIIYKFFTFIVRRVLFVSANNKFKYYDFFSNYPKEGWAGIFPTWLIPIASHYGSGYPNHYSFRIAKIYYNAPEMQSNTGFLAEGYLRWGYIGIFMSFILFALVLSYVDGVESRTSYAFALGCSISMIFSLADGYLISTLLFGKFTIWFLILFFYRTTRSEYSLKVNRKKSYSTQLRDEL